MALAVIVTHLLYLVWHGFIVIHFLHRFVELHVRRIAVRHVRRIAVLHLRHVAVLHMCC